MNEIKEKEEKEKKKEKKHIRSFVLRGRTTNSQKKYLSHYDDYKFDPTLASLPIVLDIGSGMGHYITTQAKLEPDSTFVAVEPNGFCVGSILKMVVENDIKNVKIAQMDAIDLINSLTPKIRLAQIFFPDPWPKSRHHKRRLIRQEFIDLLLPHLSPHAHIHIKTDDANYATAIAETFLHFPQFVRESSPEKITTTKYEARGLRLGNTINDFYFKLS